jgi:benzoyl-CoA-dihydrodiol lyase
VVDKRGTRKDLADVFATRADGVKGRTAVDWKLVDELAPPRRFTEVVTERAKELATRSNRPDADGVELTPLVRDRYVTEEHGDGTVTITVHAPGTVEERRDAEFWPLAMTRELDDLILRLRTNEPELGVWLFRTEGDAEVVRGYEALLGADDWFTREIVHFWKRTLKRLDVTSRSLIALVEPGSCFAGMLAELAFAADRQYVLDDQDAGEAGTLVLTDANFGTYPMSNGLTRLESRFWGDKSHVDTLRKQVGTVLSPDECKELGLVTDALDDIDWADEIRIVVEGRTALSPDACTGMEANHRFVGPETIETKIFGRLSAWQNWVFVRPNASGEDGALRRYGTGKKAVFDRRRV